MADRVIQLQDKTGTDNLYPIAGGMAADSVTKAMLAEGVFEGDVLSTPTDVDYVATDNIQDGAVTPAKASFTNFSFNTPVLIGTITDSNGVHNLYRKFYKWTDITIAQNGSTEKTINLSGNTIVGTSFTLYRTDVAGLITPTTTYFYQVYRNNGDILRLGTTEIGAQSNATVVGHIDYYNNTANGD